MERRITLVGGPCNGESLRLLDLPEVLRVPVFTKTNEPYPHDRRSDICWYRRGRNGSLHYDFDGWER